MSEPSTQTPAPRQKARPAPGPLFSPPRRKKRMRPRPGALQ